MLQQSNKFFPMRGKVQNVFLSMIKWSQVERVQPISSMHNFCTDMFWGLPCISDCCVLYKHNGLFVYK